MSVQSSGLLSIIVVDDDYKVRTLVDRVLQRAGCTTHSAGDGREALEMAERVGIPDLLVTDFSMPVMDGAELARRMREQHPDLKILYLTGQTDRLFDTKRRMWDGEAFLEKPCTPRALLEAVSLLQTGDSCSALFEAAAPWETPQ